MRTLIPPALLHLAPDMSSPPALSFFVPGKAAPGGSKSGFGFINKHGPRAGKVSVRMVDAGKGNAEWKKTCATYGQQAMRAELKTAPLDCPLTVRVVFVVGRPKYHFNSKGQLKADAPNCPTVKPDATKLMRALEDGLTGVVWVDDALIVRQIVGKVYGVNPGAYVQVWC